MGSDETDDLLAQFDHVDENTRLRAGLKIGSSEVDVVPKLVAALGDARPRVRATAAYTLGRMASSVQSLLLDLADPDVGNEMVLEPGDDLRIKHVPPTLGAVRKLFESDPDGAVRAAAFSAMMFYDEVQRDPARYAGVAAAALESDRADLRHAAAFAVSRFEPTSERAARALARVLRDPELPGSNGWQEAAMKLERMGPAAAPALPELVARLDDVSDDDLRSSLVDAIRAIDTPASRRALADLA